MTVVINGTTGVSGVDGSAGTPAVQGTDTNTGIVFPAADTVTIATGGSERLRVDNSGNVGIGTTAPKSYSKLHVAAGDNPVVAVEDVGNGVGYFSQLGSSTSIGAETQFTVATGVSFSTGPASSGTVRMTVDSSGFVKMPFQPAFHATRDTAFNAGSGVIVFPTTITNIGSGYNNSTGRFTAPVAGTYLIMTSFFTNIANAAIDFRINVNGGNVGGNATTGTTTVTRDCHAYIVYTLAINDYVTIEAAGFGTNIPSGLGIFQTFSGHLIG